MNDKLLDNDFAQVTATRLNTNALTNETSEDGHKIISICHQYCTARLSLYGGQVLSFVPAGHKDIFWLSDSAYYQAGKAIRGGIPLCWPWFGANDKSQGELKAGNHGFARQVNWLVDEITADESGVTVILTLSGEQQHPLWPNRYQLRQTLFFGKCFKQRLAMTNLSESDAQYSAALHSYFRVSNPKNIKIDALTGVNFDDKLTATSNQQINPVSCVGEIDREYHSSDAMTLLDTHWQRKMEVTSENCQQWVLWNPGVELAKTMADIHNGGEQEYVCLEAANSKWQDLPAGQTVVISQEVKVLNL